MIRAVSLADSSERSEGSPRSRCADGLDNDDDGVVDLADVGCSGALDDDESDPNEAPNCADEIDNDEDGSTDWPEDEGCAARGDACEESVTHGICDGVCLDLATDVQNCGVCGRVCEAGVECIDGFCGGLYAFEGIRQNVPDAELGGWEVWSDLYRDRNAELAAVQAACNGEFVTAVVVLGTQIGSCWPWGNQRSLPEHGGPQQQSP